MNSTAVRVENLSKEYRIGEMGKQAPYRTIREAVMDAVTAPLRARARQGAANSRFWALKDVSFEIAAGEVVGIIGLNGAGKSTLLKILSRITTPSAGRVRIRGRMASLLEVGTGFHSELSGRENIYLNGAILGMKRAEVQRKFDEIVAFAGVEKFVDTPVKRYSSGMFLRLAFAVAAHLEPEILAVDEVLAVGDVEFQRRCMGRLREVSQSGRTVFFVSHNMAAIEALCGRCLLLDAGQLVYEGDAQAVIREYHLRLPGRQGDKVAVLTELADRRRQTRVFRSVTLLDANGAPTDYVRMGESLHLRLEVALPEGAESPLLAVGIDDMLGQRLLTVRNPLSGTTAQLASGAWTVTCRVPFFPLTPGEYWVALAARVRGEWIDIVERVLSFNVGGSDVFGDGRGNGRGVCIAASEWNVGPGEA